jgi:hypothetical protein
VICLPPWAKRADIPLCTENFKGPECYDGSVRRVRRAL